MLAKCSFWLIYMHSIANAVFTISFFMFIWLKRTPFIVRLIEVAWMIEQNCVCRMFLVNIAEKLKNPSQSAIGKC